MVDYSINGSFEDPEFHRTAGEIVAIVFLTAFHIAFFIMCGIGNLILLGVTIRQKKLQTSTNILFINLVLSDSMAALLWSPILIDVLLSDTWRSGPFMCKAAEFIKRLSMFVSTNSLVVISLDRLRAVLLPLKGTMTRSAAFGSVIGIWVFSIVLGIPRIPYARTGCHHDNTCICMTEWGKDAWMTLQQYTFLLFSIEYVLPVCLMSGSYAIIGYKVWKRPMVGSVSEERMRHNMAGRKRIITLLVIVVVVFALCWLPYQIYIFNRDVINTNWMIDFNPYREVTVYFPIETVALCNGIFNTIMYIIINENLKECIKKKFQSSSCCRCYRHMQRCPSSDPMSVKTMTTANHVIHRKGSGQSDNGIAHADAAV